MKWVTREHPHTDRIACPWLIRTFIDADAEIVYVSDQEQLALELPVYDALYAWARREVASAR